MALSLGARRDQRILIGRTLVGIKAIRHLDEILVTTGDLGGGTVAAVHGLMDRIKTAQNRGSRYDFTGADKALLSQLYGRTLANEYTITDKQATELAPHVMVSAGITPNALAEYAKLAISAPPEIRIVRLPRLQALG